MSRILFTQSCEPDCTQMATSIIRTENGDYLLVGRLFDEASKSSPVITRVDAEGNTVWKRMYDFEFSAYLRSITELSNGDFAAVGRSISSDYAGDEFLWLILLNAMGEKIWEDTYGSKEEQNDGYAITATPDDGFIVTGLSLDPTSGKTSTVVLKLDRNHQLEWEKKYTAGISYTISVTKDGGYILSGATHQSVSLKSRPYVLRLDARGDKIWERVYHEYPVNVLLESAIVETDQGDFLLVAKSFIFKLDPAGEVLWLRQSEQWNLGSVATLPGENFTVAGSIMIRNHNHAYVAALDAEGYIFWENMDKHYPSAIARVLVNEEGIITGGGYGPVDGGRSQVFLAEFNPERTVALSGAQ